MSPGTVDSSDAVDSPDVGPDDTVDPDTADGAPHRAADRVPHGPAAPMPHRTLADWLRGMDDDTVAALLRARPDLAVPAPADSTVLAARAGMAASVTRACDNLDRFHLAVLTALVVAGADTAPVDPAEVVALLGLGESGRHVHEALDSLRQRALVWSGPAGLTVVPAVREVTGPYPAGLGRRDAALDSVDIEAVLAELPEDEMTVLRALAAGPAVGSTRDAAETPPLNEARTPVQRLLARGLLRAVDSGTVELPAQLGVALRGEAPLGHLELTEPELSTRRHDPERVDSTAGGAVLDLLRHAENLLTEWAREPPAVLRSGGLGVRDVRRSARTLDADEATVILVAELLVAAGLIITDESGGSRRWLPTVSTESWRHLGREQRWVTLAEQWLTLPRLPVLAGTRDDRDRPIAALSDDLRRPHAPTARRRVLDTLAELPPGGGVDAHASLVALLAWRAPLRRLRDEVVEATVAEATTLGLVALGAMSTPGRALLNGDSTAATTALHSVLPEPVDHVLVQADGTVVAPGPLVPDLTAQIELVADVESAGSATVYRISEATIRRALDAGSSAAELHQLFGTRSRTPVPQSLTYLIDDVARRHGRLRCGAAAAFLRCDDEVLLSELVSHPVADRLQLRRLAPTVLISPVPLTELLDELRVAGFTPVAEDSSGKVLDLRRRSHAPPRTGTAASVVTTAVRGLSEDQLAHLVRKIREGDALAAARTDAGQARTFPRYTENTVELLRAATTGGHSVWLGYVDSHGVTGERLVRPTCVDGGMLEGFDHSRRERWRFPLHRITWARPHETPGAGPSHS